MRSWVSLPGRVTRDELRDRYATADVYVSPAGSSRSGSLRSRRAPRVSLWSPDWVRAWASSSSTGSTGSSPRPTRGWPWRSRGWPPSPACVPRMRAHDLDHRPTQDWPQVAALAEAEYDRAVAAVGRRV